MLGMTESFGPYSSEPFDYRLPETKANASGRATTGYERRAVDENGEEVRSARSASCSWRRRA